MKTLVHRIWPRGAGYDRAGAVHLVIGLIVTAILVWALWRVPACASCRRAGSADQVLQASATPADPVARWVVVAAGRELRSFASLEAAQAYRRTVADHHPLVTIQEAGR
jgi:hypothetical protein